MLIQKHTKLYVGPDGWRQFRIYYDVIAFNSEGDKEYWAEQWSSEVFDTREAAEAYLLTITNN